MKDVREDSFESVYTKHAYNVYNLRIEHRLYAEHGGGADHIKRTPPVGAARGEVGTI